MIAGKWKTGKVPEKWDGKAGERIANKLCQICNYKVKLFFNTVRYLI